MNKKSGGPAGSALLVCIYVWKKLSDHILWIQGLV